MPENVPVVTVAVAGVTPTRWPPAVGSNAQNVFARPITLAAGQLCQLQVNVTETGHPIG